MFRTHRRLLARCPSTGKWLDTGIVVRDDIFGRLERIESWVFCPSCAEIHRWNSRTAALEGDPAADLEGTTNSAP